MSHRRAWPIDPPRGEPKRDATAAELRYEPDAVLQDLKQGLLGATPTTMVLAEAELQYRRLRGHAS